MKYKVIHCDAPWNFKTYSDKGKEKKSAENHYKTMTLKQIQALPVNEIADKDCVLFMWVTFPLLKQGIETIEAWGFTYKTCAFNWVKRNKLNRVNLIKRFVKIIKSESFAAGNVLRKAELLVEAIKGDWFWGLGYWTRSNSEICLLATKGKPSRISKSVHQVIDANIGAHSQKPACVLDKIVELCGDVPRLDMFARVETEGWSVFGNEVPNSIKL